MFHNCSQSSCVACNRTTKQVKAKIISIMPPPILLQAIFVEVQNFVISKIFAALILLYFTCADPFMYSFYRMSECSFLLTRLSDSIRTILSTVMRKTTTLCSKTTVHGRLHLRLQPMCNCQSLSLSKTWLELMHYMRLLLSPLYYTVGPVVYN